MRQRKSKTTSKQRKPLVLVLNTATYNLTSASDEILRCTVRDALYALIQLIPLGYVTSYLEIAQVLGIHPRVVARILRENKNPIAIPCHRVVKNDLSLGSYTLQGRAAPKFKLSLLRLEGVKLTLTGARMRVSEKSFIKLSKLLK